MKLIAIIFLNICLCLSNIKASDKSSQAIVHAKKAAITTQTIFGKSGLNIADSELNYIEEIIYNALQASDSLNYEAAQVTIELLEKKQKEVEAKINHQKAKNDYVKQYLFHEQFIIKQIIFYLNNFRETFSARLPWYKKYILYLKSFFKQESDAQSFGQNIYAFINYGIENYLLNYDKLLIFFAGSNKEPLPDILNFWQQHDTKKSLQRRADAIKQTARVQQWSELLTIGIQSLVLGGESMYKQWLDQDAAAKFALLQQQQKKIQDDFQIYLKNLENNQQNVIKTLNNALIASQDVLKKKYQELSINQQQEITYLLQSVNLDAPLTHYLMYPIIPWDQLFENGIMLTPNNGYTWYNVYQFHLANTGWGFDSFSNSFWQNALILFGTPFWNKTASGTKVDPSQNSIFTEYISTSLQYDIEIEMQLVNCSYPFFAGIFFNRSRWISADPERIWQYRLIGLYGNQSDPNDPKTRTINLSFSQQQINFQSDSTGKKTEAIISPLEQIATDPQKQLFAIPSIDIIQLDKQPITYSCAITTAPTSAQVTFSKITNGTKQQLYTTTLNNLDSYSARFHGIGFMSPGCQTKFTIKKPIALTYSAEQLQEFNKQLETNIQPGT